MLTQRLQCFKDGLALVALAFGVGGISTMQACPLVIKPLGELRGFVDRF